MDKNTVTGFILIALVLIGFNWYSRPSEAEMQEMARQDSIRQAEQAIAQAQAQADDTQADTRALQLMADSTALFHSQLTGEEQDVVLRNEHLEVTLSTKGGKIKQAIITGGSGIKAGSPVRIMDADNHLHFTLSGKRDNIDTDHYYFTPVARTDSSVVMRLQATDGSSLDIQYALHTGSYLLDITVSANGMARHLEPGTKTMLIEWQKTAKMLEKGFDFENRFSSLTYKEKEGGVDNLSETSEELLQSEKPLDWVAFKNQFFSCVLIGHQDLAQASLSSKPAPTPDVPVRYESPLKEYSATMQTAFDGNGSQPTRLQLYVGPNDFHLLKETNRQGLLKTDLRLEEMIYFGWPIVRWINRFFILYLFDWLNGLGLSMGLVLLLLTIIVKILVYPTTKKSYLSSAKMRVLKPQVDEIGRKYPKQEDAMKKQQEMMQLYSQYGVSPMGGCLPMLIQTPIWIALFNFVPNAIELRGEPFLWADDLSAYDDVISWGTHIWLIGDHLSIFCLLFCLTNIINTWISMRQQQNQMSSEQAQQMKMMQYMMYAMPVMFFFMFNNYSSGLCYYYFLSGLTSILIMWVLRKRTDDAKLLAKLEAYRQQHKNDPRKTTGLAARLEALQKMQEQQTRRQ